MSGRAEVPSHSDDRLAQPMHPLLLPGAQHEPMIPSARYCRISGTVGSCILPETGYRGGELTKYVDRRGLGHVVPLFGSLFMV